MRWSCPVAAQGQRHRSGHGGCARNVRARRGTLGPLYTHNRTAAATAPARSAPSASGREPSDECTMP
eukprot:12429690-Alexandrium_andersonii.AAC.1